MKASLQFRCTSCNARLKAPMRLIDHARSCPACGKRIVIRPRAPQQAGPVLVPMDNPARPPGRLAAGD